MTATAETVDPQSNIDLSNLYRESTYDIDPTFGFYLNAVVGAGIIAFMTIYNSLANKGTHDNFLFYSHLITWSQNLLVWVYTYYFDTELTRMVYFRSSFLPAIIPYIGMPIYLLWLVFYYMTALDGEISTAFFIITFIWWSAIAIVERLYLTEILTAIYNYWMQLVEQDLKSELIERAQQETNGGDTTDSFTSPEDGTNDGDDDDILDIWIF